MSVSRGVDLHHSVSQGLWKELNLLQAAGDTEFRRQRRLHHKKVGCRAGCDACCHVPFSISEIEAAAIHRELPSLETQLRRELQESARAYLTRRVAMFEEHGYCEGRGELLSHETRLPCPALVNGRCAIYRARPTLCRVYGVAVIHSNHSNRVFAFQLNFIPGEQIEDPDLSQRQALLAQQKSVVQRTFSESGGRRFREPVTVAHAILDDFETYLPSDVD